MLQLTGSDIIDIAYTSNDAGIAYNTLDILNEVFARQYQQLRYGETNNVIKFFEREVARLYRILTNAEDDLIRYNISKRIINYGEQTKQLTVLEAQQQNFRNDQLMNYTTSKALMDYLSANVKYPEAAKQAGISGRVTTIFVVGEDGVIRDVKVVRSVSPELDAEAIRVMSSMPKWKPGKQDGKPVPVRYTVPVNFRGQ